MTPAPPPPSSSHQIAILTQLYPRMLITCNHHRTKTSCCRDVPATQTFKAKEGKRGESAPKVTRCLKHAPLRPGGSCKPSGIGRRRTS